MALGQDYMSAGVFDRAERIFLEVVELGGSKETSSLHGLLAIYQQEKAWEKALDVIKKLEISTGTSLHNQAAHYYCEMANQALKINAIDRAVYCIKQAMNVDTESVRASLMNASIEMKEGRYKQAIRSLKRVPQQDAEFLSEIIEPLVFCHKELDLMADCINYLEQTLAESSKSFSNFRYC